jgi:predicted transcriptional regulator of viral defense system
MQPKRQDRFGRAIEIYEANGGILRTSQAIKFGVHQATIYTLRDQGILIEIARGVHRLADLPSLGNPDFIAVTLKIPKAVICLISALSFHDLTTQIPHFVYLAVRRTAMSPKLNYPPIRVFRYAAGHFDKGIDNHEIDGRMVRIYSPERTIMDCFKYRNRIGLDVAVEALKIYRERGRMKTELLAEYARMNRVRKIVAPYLEAML